MRVRRSIPVLALAACAGAAWAEPPPLPPGLPPAGEKPKEDAPKADEPKPTEPALPSGLPGAGAEPALPPGLDGKPDTQTTLDTGGDKAVDVDFSGFLDGRYGVRTQNDPYEKQVSVGELRLQLEGDFTAERWTARLVGDFLIDPVADRYKPNYETGEGFIDLREAWVAFSPLDNTDVKIGRQILTWGTGDLLFINDLFPKDWNSFFVGRDVEYLKAPSDAVRVSVYTDAVNVDVAYVPNFDPDRYIDGERISYYNPELERIAGRDAIIDAQRPGSWFQDDEIHLRLNKRVEAIEYAAYGYHGYWKSPAGVNPAGQAIFPALNVLGASVRGPMGGGIASAELGYYDSADDRSGNDGLINNSEMRYLVGYERELAADLTLGLQYYIEQILQYDGYQNSLPPGVPQRDEFRHVITTRLTLNTNNQNVVWSFFGYFSPTDQDLYIRPSVLYKVDDHWTTSLGANFFDGVHDYTFFGQFKQNTNVYVSLRYSF